MKWTRRQCGLLLAGAARIAPVVAAAAPARKFWLDRDPAQWSPDEKLVLLSESPWAQGGVAEFDPNKKRRSQVGYGNDGRIGNNMPSGKPGARIGGDMSAPIGEEIPPVPNPHPGEVVRFSILARWETAEPVRLANSLVLPDMGEQVYILSLRGLPLMPPPKPPRRGEEPLPDPNIAILRSVQKGSRLVRKDKPPILCTKLFAGKGDAARDVLLIFPRDPDPIVEADKFVYLESSFAPYELSIKFTLKDMKFKGVLTL
jgi:hypothetical protein